MFFFNLLVTELGATSSLLMNAALKLNTRRTYTSAQSRFLKFCAMYKLVAMPVTEDTLLLYQGCDWKKAGMEENVKVCLLRHNIRGTLSDFPNYLPNIGLKMGHSIRI